MMKADQFKVRIAAAAMSVAVAFSASSLAAFAATGTVNDDSVNVRSDASTSSSIVGTASNGDELEVGDSKEDDSGNTWYQVTLSDGSTGYIRNDFITVTEDEAPSEADSEQNTEETPQTDSTSDTAAGTTETGDYQVVQAPDDDNNMVYYLYNNAAGERMKISDIEALQTRVSDAETAAANAGNKYRIILIALAVLLILALVGCVTLGLRLKDAMTNGRRERDLTRDRANERRRGGGADDLTAVKRRTREDRRSAASSRSNAYASGTRRRPAPTDDGAAPETRRERPMRDDRRVANEGDYSRVREGARPARTGNDMGRETGRRPVADERRQAPEARRERPVRPAGDEDVRTQRPRSKRAVRSTNADDQRQAAPRSSAVQNDAPARAQRAQARNFAEDDDFDYDFISLDDK